MARIETIELRRDFPKMTLPALNGANLVIEDGESMALLGPSGCGKTTLLRCIAGLEPYEGAVLYDGQDMREVPPKDRGIGLVFQNYALYPNFESKGNLGFFFKLRKRETEIDERVKQTAEIMGLGFETLLDRMPRTLSGGQKQRVAIARAICRDPKLLLFDEPLSNLDAKLRSDTRIQIRRLISRFSVTTVYVTHDQSEATLMGDRLAVMDQGKIVQVGTYRELYDRPANTFVAGFLGTPPMNLLNGLRTADGIRVGDSLLALPASGQALPNGASVIVGIRPQQLQVDPHQPWFSAPVEIIERLPAERLQLCHFSMAGHGLVAALPLETDIALNSVVPLRPVGEVALFSSDNGLRL